PEHRLAVEAEHRGAITRPAESVERDHVVVGSGVRDAVQDVAVMCEHRRRPQRVELRPVGAWHREHRSDLVRPGARGAHAPHRKKKRLDPTWPYCQLWYSSTSTEPKASPSCSKNSQPKSVKTSEPSLDMGLPW